MRQIYKVGIFFDSKNSINYKFFNKKSFLKKIKKKSKFKFIFTFKKALIHKCNIGLLVGFTSKVNIKKKIDYFTVHESALPKGKGHSPIKHQIFMNRRIITCCLIKLNKYIDGGDIVFKQKLKINKNDFFEQIKNKQMKITQTLFTKLLNVYPKYKAIKQKGKSTFFPKLTEKDDQINPKKSLASQMNILRSTNYFEHKNFFTLDKKKFYIILKKNSEANRTRKTNNK
tara:strand:+ start:1625 stop:2308 length:684 start_codon:yes stop_codon:yes gene_type:complete